MINRLNGVGLDSEEAAMILQKAQETERIRLEFEEKLNFKELPEGIGQY